jgi:hypothetical protein
MGKVACLFVGISKDPSDVDDEIDVKKVKKEYVDAIVPASVEVLSASW